MKQIFGIVVLLTLFICGPVAAADDCEKAIQLYNYGTLSRNLKEKEKLFKEALTLSCNDRVVVSRIHNNLADTYETAGRFEESIREYKKAISINPDLATPYISLGDVYSKIGNKRFAAEYYDKYYRLSHFKTKDRIRSSLSLRSATRSIRAVPSEDLYFGFDESVLTPESEKQLDELLSALNDGELRSYRFQLTGYTCTIGGNSYNQRLSERRAESVSKWLVAHGYPAVQLQTEGQGKKYPVADNATEEGRKLNRRVEVRTAGLIIPEIVRSGKQKAGIDLLEEGRKLLNENKYRESASAHEQALAIFKEDNFRDGIRTTSGNLYLIYLTLGNREKAQNYLKVFRESDKE